MEFNIGILIAQGINFLVLLFLFKWLIGDTLSKAIESRRSELAKAENASKIYEDTMLKAEEEKKSLLNEALAHKQQLIDEAKSAASMQAQGIVDDAEKKAAQLVSAAENKAKVLESELEENFVTGVKQTAEVIVKKLFKKDVALQEAYVNELVDEFSNA